MRSSATTKDHLWPWKNPEHSQLLLQLFLLLLFGVSLHLSKQKSPNKPYRMIFDKCCTVFVSTKKNQYILLCSSEEKRFPFKAIPVMLHSSKFMHRETVINHLKRPLLLYRDMTLNFTTTDVLNTSLSFTLRNCTAARAWWNAAGQTYGRGLVISFAYSFARPNRISFSPVLHSKWNL